VPVQVLVTAFEPFGAWTLNSSLEAADALAASSPAGIELATATLPVAYSGAVAALTAAVRQADPDVVIALGQAEGRAAITPERIAVNLDEAEAADNEGVVSLERPIVAGAPAAYLSTLPVRAIVERLRGAGIPAKVSRTAGGYLCNHVFYGLMHLLATERPGTSGGFVHVPLLPEQAPDGKLPTLGREALVRGIGLVVESAALRPAPPLAAPA
jgi:pyroglutamyl-peptidase